MNLICGLLYDQKDAFLFWFEIVKICNYQNIYKHIYKLSFCILLD